VSSEPTTAYKAGSATGMAVGVLGAPVGLVLLLTGSTVLGASVIAGTSALTAVQTYRRWSRRKAQTP
jgi:hypothetical protein